MRKIMCVAAAAALLVSVSAIAEAAPAQTGVVKTHRCTTSRDYCIVIAYTKKSPHRVPLVIAHKVSARRGHTYRARWTYRQPGAGTKSSGWKKTGWSGDNGRAPGIAVEAIWGRGSGPKLPTGTTVCTQFKGSTQKVCFRLG